MDLKCLLVTLSVACMVVSAAPPGDKSLKIVSKEMKPKDSRVDISSDVVNKTVEKTVLEDVEKNEITENENCTGKHRPHATDATKFETYFTGMWIEQPCPGLNLVWDQVSCRCDYPPKHFPGEPCKDRRTINADKGLYEQHLNGKWYARDCNLGKREMTWNQTECECKANVTNQKMGGSPCDVMLNVTFNNEVVVDHAKGAWIQRPWDSRIVIRKVSGAIGNWAAHIQDSAMRVFYFAGNAWSDMMQVFISFRADKDLRVSDKFQMLLSNGCNYTWIGYFEPSVALSYRPKDGTLQLQFQTYEPKTLSCNIISDFHGWHSVAMLYQDGMLQLVVDGYLCLASRDFSGPVKVNQCPLTIAADPLERASNFRGFLDEFNFANLRYRPSPQVRSAPIKIDTEQLLITRYCKV